MPLLNTPTRPTLARTRARASIKGYHKQLLTQSLHHRVLYHLVHIPSLELVVYNMSAENSRDSESRFNEEMAAATAAAEAKAAEEEQKNPVPPINTFGISPVREDREETDSIPPAVGRYDTLPFVDLGDINVSAATEQLPINDMIRLTSALSETCPSPRSPIDENLLNQPPVGSASGDEATLPKSYPENQPLSADIMSPLSVPSDGGNEQKMTNFALSVKSMGSLRALQHDELPTTIQPPSML